MNERSLKIIVNADDVGMHPTVDQAIATLAARGLLSSASVMSLGSPCPDALSAMLAREVDLGLHLDFTSELAARAYGTSYSVKSLIAEGWLRRMKPDFAKRIIDDQLARFEDLVGAPPRFVDGHEHVHQFPVIRETLFEVLAQRYQGRRFFIRNTTPRTWQGAKAAVIGLLGARETGRLLRDHGHRCNNDFLGVYDFSPASDPAGLWSEWLENLKHTGSLLMCHPSTGPAVQGDVIGQARIKEFQFMMSQSFADLLVQHKVEIAGWERALA